MKVYLFWTIFCEFKFNFSIIVKIFEITIDIYYNSNAYKWNWFRFVIDRFDRSFMYRRRGKGVKIDPFESPW